MTTAHPLQGKVAFVQGGSRGIGAAIVKRLASEGAAVAFTYAASADRAEAVASAITAAGGKALAIKADSADAAALQQAVRRAVSHFGNTDILVNNAGVFTLGSTEELALDDLDRMLAVNVRSVFVASRSGAPHERRRPHHPHRQHQRRARAVRRRGGVCDEQIGAGRPDQGHGARSRPARHHRQ